MDDDWRRKAQCRDMPPDMFFPTDHGGVEQAKRVCDGCSVKGPCLEFALQLTGVEDSGIYGGTSARERRRIRAVRQRTRGGRIAG